MSFQTERDMHFGHLTWFETVPLYLVMCSYSEQGAPVPLVITISKDYAEQCCERWAQLYADRVHKTHNGYAWNNGQGMCALVKEMISGGDIFEQELAHEKKLRGIE